MIGSLAAILVSWNSSEDLVTLIPALANNQDITKIVIVDNDSTDNTVALVKNFQSQFKMIELISNQENLGFSGGVNRGIRYCLENNLDCFCLINCDITLQENTISELKCFLSSHQDYAAVSPVLLNPDHSVQVYGGGKVNWILGTSTSFHHKVDDTRFDYLSAACLLVRTRIVEEIGLFDEDNFFMYWEDIDFGLRIKKAGWKLGVCQTSECFHEMSKSLGRFDVLKDYYTVTSLKHFFRKHLGAWSFFAIHIAIILKMAKRMITFRFRNMAYILKGYLKA